MRCQGLDRFEARKRVVEMFRDLGLLEKVEDHRHAVGHCYRCHTIIEPRLSDQWFVKMAPLARPALAAYRDGSLRFIPERRGEEYAPVDGEHPRLVHLPAALVGTSHPGLVLRQLRQDDREPGGRAALRLRRRGAPGRGRARHLVLVLAGPFSSLGWPRTDRGPDAFYPGNVLVTAPEIIFFWVARMVMAGCEFMGGIPFSTVYLHGTVRDTQHRKMSKSLGNGVDPLEVVQRFGADALRYTLVSGMSVGTDVILDPDDLDISFAPGRNFANKLWNAGRFILTNLEGPTRPLAGRPDALRKEDLHAGRSLDHRAVR